MDGISESNLNELLLESLRQGRCALWRVASNSMAPVLEVGDRVTVAPFGPDSGPRMGDVVLLTAGDRWAVHRLIGTMRREGQLLYRQKGDAGLRAQSVPRSAIHGRVVAVEKSGSGRVIDLCSARMRFIDRTLGGIFNVFDMIARREKEYFTGTGLSRGGRVRVLVARLFRAVRKLVTMAATALYRTGMKPKG